MKTGFSQVSRINRKLWEKALDYHRLSRKNLKLTRKRSRATARPIGRFFSGLCMTKVR